MKPDIHEELQRIVPESIEIEIFEENLKELRRIKHKYSKPAMELMQKKNIKIVQSNSEKDIDTRMLKYAEENKAVIATLDSELKKKALKKGLHIITVRQGKYLIFQ